MGNLLGDKKVYELQEKVDKELAEKAYGKGCCEHCDGGKLHCANYERKPRGGPEEVMNRWNRRHSFCCNLEGCRKRKTPPSVRFLGSKVYVGVVVVLVAAVMYGPNARRVDQLHEALGIDKRTLNRWRQWWLEVFVEKSFWKVNRARFMPVLDEAVMPYGLVEKFKATQREGLMDLMKFLAPITTTSGKGVVAM